MALKMTFNEIYDISTSTTGPSIYAIHTPTSSNLYRLMKPQFDSYKRFKYVKADVTIVNGMKIQNPSTAYSVEAGNITADPRDLLDPILFRGCHGEDLGTILNQIYNANGVFTDSSLDEKTVSAYLTQYYYTCLSDNSWKKGNTSSTLRIPGLHPLVYRVASNAPLNNSYPGNGVLTIDRYTGGHTAPPNSNTSFDGSQVSSSGIPLLSDATGYVSNPENYTNNGTGQMSYTYARQLFTDKMMGLGWLPTKQPFETANTSQSKLQTETITRIPKIFMGVLMIPKAWKSFTFMRLIIRHTILFSGLRTFSEGSSELVAGSDLVFNDDPKNNDESGLYINELPLLDDGD